jgi:hypothetical protein
VLVPNLTHQLNRFDLCLCHMRSPRVESKSVWVYTQVRD